MLDRGSGQLSYSNLYRNIVWLLLYEKTSIMYQYLCFHGLLQLVSVLSDCLQRGLLGSYSLQRSLSRAGQRVLQASWYRWETNTCMVRNVGGNMWGRVWSGHCASVWSHHSSPSTVHVRSHRALLLAHTFYTVHHEKWHQVTQPGMRP